MGKIWSANELFQTFELAVSLYEQSFLILAPPKGDKRAVLVTCSQLLLCYLVFTV
jgi:hypothetical protein